ncbi:hypothetical protein LCGC14_2207520, partial [marine sediment metagenome]
MATSFLVVKNRATSKLAAALTSGALSVDVTAGEGSEFPSTYPFHITIEDEILEVTDVTTDTLTFTRAAQGTSAAAHPNKAHVFLNITAKSVTDLNTAVNAIENDYAAASGLATLNASTKVVQQPASITDHLDDTAGGTNGVVTKAPTSNVMYDHANAGDPHTGYRLESADHSHQTTGLQAGKLDHGAALNGLGDNDHTQYILHSLADAANDFLVASGNDAYAKKTLAETLALISPLTTRGDIMFRNATISTRLAKGADNTMLAMGAADPEWKTPATILADLSGQAAAAFAWNSQNLSGIGTLDLTGDLTTPGSIISTGGGQTGKFLTGAAGNTVFAFSGDNFDVRAGTGGSASQNVMRVTSAGDIGIETLNTHTIPGGTDTFAMLAATQELDNKTLDSSVLKGTFTASGTVVLPAFTLGGTMDANSQALINVLDLDLGTESLTGTFSATLTAANAGTAWVIRSRDSIDIHRARLGLSGGVDTAVWSWV